MIQPNTAERITHLAVDGSGQPLTGVTDLVVTIVNLANGQIWDWSADAFSATPAQPTEALAEVNATYAPGLYSVSWPGASAGTYVAILTQASGTVANVPAPAELRATPYAQTGDAMTLTSGERSAIWAVVSPNASWTYGGILDLVRGWITNKHAVSPVSGILYRDNGTTPWLAWIYTDANGESITTPSGAPSIRQAAT